jgi:acyl dehydratase
MSNDMPTNIFNVGDVIGPGAWVTVDQEMINGFAVHTRDPDPFHIDPAWAKANSPFGGTIAYGFLTISLLTHLLYGAQGDAARDVTADPSKHGHFMNYGFDKLRLIAPVKVGSRIRGLFTIANRKVDAQGRNVVILDATIEIENEERPALAAQWITIWIPGTSA